MQTREIVIRLSDDVFNRLEKAAGEASQKPEEYAAALISKGISHAPSQEPAPSFPSVALLKNDFKPALLDTTSAFAGNAGPTSFARLQPAGTGSSFPSYAAPGSPAIANPPSPEKLQRKKSIEEQMRELSILVETASADKKEEYLLQYAILAAELDSLI